MGSRTPWASAKVSVLHHVLLPQAFPVAHWLFTWLDLGGKRTAAILSIIATCIAHDVNPRAYLHLLTKLIVHGWPQAKLRDLLPDRILAVHPELYIGDTDALPALVNAAAVGG